MYRLRTAPIPAYDTFPVQELQGYHTCHDEYLCHSEQASTRRKNIGNDIVSRYLMIDLEPLTKKAEIELLNKHPLAAPRKSVRSNGRSRASRVITKIHERKLCGPSVAHMSENHCRMQENLNVIPEQIFQHVESKELEVRGNEGDNNLDESRSELSDLDFDLEDDLDDNDLMDLHEICGQRISTPLIETSNPTSPVTTEGSPKGTQAPFTMESCEFTTSQDYLLGRTDIPAIDGSGNFYSMPLVQRCLSAESSIAKVSSPAVSANDQDYGDTFEEDLLTDMDLSDMDEFWNLTPGLTVLRSSTQATSISRGASSVTEHLQPSVIDLELSSRLREDDVLEEIDLSQINKLPWDSALLPQPRAPIQRSLFPRAVSSHSPVVGLTSQTFLRTCFRIGEALNTGCNAVRNNRHEILELFCRVSAS